MAIKHGYHWVDDTECVDQVLDVTGNVRYRPNAGVRLTVTPETSGFFDVG